MSSSIINSYNYIYLLQEREFIKTNENIFKIGRSTQEHTKRFQQYPKGSRLILQIECINCKTTEKSILGIFRCKYKQRKDIGNEYFEGDYMQMMDDIYSFVLKYNKEMIIDVKSVSDSESDISLTDSCSTDNTNTIVYTHANDPYYELYKEHIEDIEDEENEEEDEKIIVETYEDYMKYSYIKSIIVTNKYKYNGYLRYNNHLWRKFVDISEPLYNETSDENLEGFLLMESNQCSTVFKNKTSGTIINSDDILNISRTSLNNYKPVSVTYNVEKILKDIRINCYNKNPNYYNLKYNEFVVHINDNTTRLFDSKLYTFKDINTVIENKILEGPISSRVMEDAYTDKDTTIVNDILTSLIPDRRVIDRFKQLCYHVLVEPSETPIIFNDICKNISDEGHQLSSWLSSMVYTLGVVGVAHIEMDYKYNKKLMSSLIKEHRKSPPRCVVLYNIHEVDIAKFVSEFSDIGVKHYIIKNYGSRDSIYNFDNCRKFLYDNILRIKSNCSNKDDIRCERYTPVPSYDVFIDDVFYSTSMLFSHFVKWCVT
jgi:hypothetical protein